MRQCDTQICPVPSRCSVCASQLACSSVLFASHLPSLYPAITHHSSVILHLILYLLHFLLPSSIQIDSPFPFLFWSVSVLSLQIQLPFSPQSLLCCQSIPFNFSIRHSTFDIWIQPPQSAFHIWLTNGLSLIPHKHRLRLVS